MGLVTEFDDVLAGEVIDGGPVVLSWDDIVDPSLKAAGNVVIHEFVHKLDLADAWTMDARPCRRRSVATGWPPWTGRSSSSMHCSMTSRQPFQPDIDPDSDAADPWFDTLPLDPYAATDPPEFFAVAAEAFFVAPARFTEAFPEMHDCFVKYFQQKAPPVGPHRSAPSFG